MDNQKGYVIVTTALLLVALLGFGALAVDVGLLYSARTAAQRAADAAALAGAFTFVVDPSSAQPSTAYDQAMSTALSNNNVVAHLLGVFGCGSLGPPAGSEETGPFSLLVRLVRLPEE